jgi:hypothetical protein
MLFLPSLASCRLLSTGVHFENHVGVMSGDERPHIELASGMEPNDQPRLLAHDPELIRKNFLEVLPIKHAGLDLRGRSSAA